MKDVYDILLKCSYIFGTGKLPLCYRRLLLPKFINIFSIQISHNWRTVDAIFIVNQLKKTYRMHINNAPHALKAITFVSVRVSHLRFALPSHNSSSVSLCTLNAYHFISKMTGRFVSPAVNAWESLEIALFSIPVLAAQPASVPSALRRCQVQSVRQWVKAAELPTQTHLKVCAQLSQSPKICISLLSCFEIFEFRL